MNFLFYFIFVSFNIWGTPWPSWLRHCTTSREVAGSIPDGVTGIFLSHFFPRLDSVSKRHEYLEYFLAGKGESCLVLTSSPHSCADQPEMWAP